MCARIYLQSLEDFSLKNGRWEERWLVNATRLWNWADCQDCPEPYWTIMDQILPEFFVRRDDANSALLTYHDDSFGVA